MAPRSEDHTLIIRVITSPIHTPTVHQRYGRTDRQADGRTDDLR